MIQKILCYILLSTCIFSCQKLMDRAESALECDEEIDVKFKIDFKDKDERTLEQLTTKVPDSE